MRAFIAQTLSLLLAFQSAYAAPAVESDKQTELILRATAQQLNSHHTYADLIGRLFAPKDRDFLRKTLGPAAKLPVKAQFIEHNSLVLNEGDGAFTVQVHDGTHFEILKKEFVYKPGEPVEQAIDRLSRLMSTTDRRWELLEPEANALPPGVSTAIKWTLRYVSIAAIAAYFCASRDVNSVKSCAAAGAAWPVEAAEFLVGLVMVGANIGKNYLSDGIFNITQIKCAQPLHAIVLDSNGQPVTVDLYMTKDGAPDRLEIKNGAGKTQAFFMASDWSLDPARQSALNGTDAGKIAWNLLSKAARNLSQLCQGADSKTALERYLKQKESGTGIVAPKSDTPGTAVMKSAQ